ncbi:hemicentin-1-like isoform X1 [Dreissena polymorpha]|uniref:hemicentin-1-like isoform X1 n=1 Tax=Dreissena polymorpha TaxID=45954 RepID=UPI00226408CF|nr:hemicentin-1-like isoform X1 [Dreissena polymorpha]
MGCSVFNCIFYMIWIFLLKGFNTTQLTLTLTTDVNDIFVNSSITLRCSTPSTPKTVTWLKREKGSESIETVIFQKWVKETNSCITNNNAMECSCSSSQAYSCSIKSANVSNDGQRWLCKAVISNVNLESNIYTIRLVLPLTSLTILPRTSVAYPAFNVVSNFTCITSLSRPAASIQWFIDNRNITHLAIHSNNDDVARSDLQYKPNANGYSSGNISCVAKYEFEHISKVLTANMSIQVQYPVSNPIVTVNNRSISTGFAIREDRLVHLNCFSTGYPQPLYNWTYPGGRSTGALLKCAFTRNNGNVSCKAYNVMRTLDGTNSAEAKEKNIALQINVLYPPVITKLSSNDKNVDINNSTIRVQRGDNISIVCTSDANPPATVFWNGQLSVVSTLSVTSVQHDAVWTCQATNSMTEFDGETSTSSATRNISAIVLYSPEVQRLQNQTVLLNTSLTVLCNLTNVGNPPASNFSWIRKDTGKVMSTGQKLTIKNIRLTDEGEYQCNASNIMQPITNEVLYGLSQSTVYINVEYEAYVRVFKANQSNNSIVVNQGETVDLVCDADGDPEPVVRLMNTTRGNERILVEIKGNEAKYHIQQANCEYDIGNYTCSAKNHYNEGRQWLALFVYCSPRTSPFSPPVTTLYRAPNDTVLFTFTIIAYPKPTSQDIVWYKRNADSWRLLSDDANSVVAISDDSMQTQLKIFHVQLKDYTDYMVNVSNKWGSTVRVFTLKALSKPEVPKEIQVSRTGQTELIIEWIPGFNGGESQTFTIRYKALSDGSWMFFPLNISHYIWTIDGLKSGTTYQIQMMALNTIGQSDWTQEINITTLFGAVIVGKGPTSSAIWGSIGGAAGVVIIVAVLVVIWKHRTRGLITTKHCRTKRTSLTKYEDLIRGQGNNDASTTDGSYATCIIDPSQSRNANQNKTLVELESRDNSILSTCNAQRDNTTSAKISASGQTDVSTTDPEYVNLQLFTN